MIVYRQDNIIICMFYLTSFALLCTFLYTSESGFKKKPNNNDKKNQKCINIQTNRLGIREWKIE